MPPCEEILDVHGGGAVGGSWSGNASVFPWKRWRRWSGSLCLGFWPHDPNLDKQKLMDGWLGPLIWNFVEFLISCGFVLNHLNIPCAATAHRSVQWKGHLKGSRFPSLVMNSTTLRASWLAVWSEFVSLYKCLLFHLIHCEIHQCHLRIINSTNTDTGARYTCILHL